MSVTPDDVLNLVRQQHEQLRTMLGTVEQANEAQRKAAFATLRRFLTAHEAAEETYVQAAESTKDHAEQWASRLESMNAQSEEFRKAFSDFSAALINHTEQEVTVEMPKIFKEMTEEQLNRTMAAFERVSQFAEDDTEEKEQ